MKRPDPTVLMLPFAALVAGVLVLTGCAPDLGGATAGTPAPSPAGSHRTGPASAIPTAPAPDETASLGQRACILFGKTFEQKVAAKLLNQERAASIARQAASEDARWETIARDMALIARVGKRINLDHDSTVTPSESNDANRAVDEVRQNCAAAGAGFTLPAD
ncbi:hypothetical protein [Leifsonia shinshuensis]|uniref:Uncharacterized protein n=1 Tax=Leifsonia shinshuensis TaxID=150026 RepID=A0A853CVF8_9MICO|nr:hypothetical protein [Leifsonia shinshuensis]NYJ22555.1 hypothetical protein [Leifsonia shinshuensis]